MLRCSGTAAICRSSASKVGVGGKVWILNRQHFDCKGRPSVDISEASSDCRSYVKETSAALETSLEVTWGS